MLGQRDLSIAVMVLLSSLAARSVVGDDQCGVYLAISSTSTVEETKWGMYAGKEISAGASVGYPDLAVNLFHLKANSAFEEDEDGEEDYEYLNQVVDFFEAFIWVPDSSGGKFELGQGRTVTAIPGAGVLGGFNGKLTNAEWKHLSAYARPGMGEQRGKSHPGRGSYTHLYDVTLAAKSDISAGSEIFLDYGENWQEQDDAEEELSKEDFSKIDETVAKMIAFFEKHEGELDVDAKSAIYNFLTKDVMNAAVGVQKGRMVAALLPPNPDNLYQVLEAGGSLAFSQPTVYRSVDWLEQHGRCLDNIRPGASTIPNAGRGAFATRKISAGGLVSPVPLIHIPDAGILDMHDVQPSDDDEFVRVSDEVKGQQLLLNYCFGHPESSMVFFPAGSVSAFINHHDEPNAKLVWSDHQLHQKLWLDEDPGDLMDDEHGFIGLLMEIVATKDIDEGEEVFIDYGSDWKEAYERHVSDWEARLERGEVPKEWPAQAVDMNDEYRTKTFKLEDELDEAPYPKNVALKAFLMILETNNAGSEEDPKQWGEPVNGTAYNSDNLFTPVVVDVKKIDDNTLAMPYNYTVRWANNRGKHTFVENIPHEAFVFVDKPGFSDQFVTNPFRHYIGIPDEIFPEGPWRNI